MKKVLPILYVLILSSIFTAQLISQVSQENSIIEQQEKRISTNLLSLNYLPIELKQEITTFFINTIFNIYKSKAEQNNNNNNSEELKKCISSLKNMSLINKNFSSAVNKKLIGTVLRRAGKEKLVELFKNAYKKGEFEFADFLLLANNTSYKTVQASDVFDTSLEDMLVKNILIGQNGIISDKNIQQIKILLKMGANVNVIISSIDDKYIDFSGQSILHLIVGIGDCYTVYDYSFGSCKPFNYSYFPHDSPYDNETYPRMPVNNHQKKGHNLEILVEKVLNAGANVNSQDTNTGNTALHIAIEHNRKEVANMLLQCGTDFTIKNNSGLTALDIAMQRGYFPRLYRAKK